MKNSEIVAIVESFVKIKQNEEKKRADGLYVNPLSLPAAVAWKRRVNLKKLVEAQAIIFEAFHEIDQKYSDDSHSMEASDGNRKVKEEFLKGYLSERASILDQDTDVSIVKIKIEDLDGIELTDDDLDTLAFMIEE